MVTIIVNGRAWTGFTTLSVEADWFTPTDAWSTTLMAPALVVAAGVQPGALVEVMDGQDVVVRGRIDAVTRQQSRSGTQMTLRGRDMGATLVDALPTRRTWRNTTVWTVVKAAATAAGLTPVQTADPAFTRPVTTMAARPGETWAALLSRLAAEGGAWVRVTRDGRLSLSRPDYSSPPAGMVVLGGDAKDWEHTFDITERPGRLYRPHGDDDVSAAAAEVQDAEAEALWPGRRAEVGGNKVTDRRRSARQVMEVERDRRRFESETLTVTVAGWRVAGQVWSPGLNVVVQDSTTGLGGAWWLQGVRLSHARAGSEATLTLRRPNILKEVA